MYRHRYIVESESAGGKRRPYTNHQFGISETIEAIIRKINGENISKFDRSRLMREYNILNKYTIPKVGDRAKIPLLPSVEKTLREQME